MRRILIALAVLAAAGVAVGTFALRSAAGGVAPDELEARYLTADDRFVEVAGARLRVREQGPPGAPVLLMLHGFTFSLESWDALADALSSDYRVVRYDLLGHGLTGPDPKQRYAPEDRAAFAGEVMDALGIEEAVLVGNSLGGLIAWRLAASAPERARALVLVAPGAYPINGVTDEPAPVPAAVAAYLRLAPEAGVEAAAASIFADPEALPSGRLRSLRDMMRREGNGEAFVRSLSVFTLPDPDADLARVTAPTLLVWGARDSIVPPAHGPRLAAALPDARLVTYDGTGHAPQEEAPERLAADIRTFLDEANGRAEVRP